MYKKYLLFLILLFYIPFSLAAESNDIQNKNTYKSIDYIITRIKDKNITKLKIDMKIKGNIVDDMIVELPSFWARGHYWEQIKNVKIVDNKEYITEIIKKKNEDREESQHQINIKTLKPQKEINISYVIVPDNNVKQNYFNIILRNDFIAFPGYGVFAYPSDVEKYFDFKEDKLIDLDISISWNNIPDDWQVISSHGIGKNITIKKGLTDAYYVAGNKNGKLKIFDLSENSKQKAYLSLYGDFLFGKEEAKKLLKKIISGHRNFFNDTNDKYYFVSLLNRDFNNEGGNDDKKKKFTSIGGSAFYNSFALGFLNLEDDSRYIFDIILTHEILHHWIGKKIKHSLGSKQEDAWFSEGFTDYFARILAFRHEIISFDQFIYSINELLDEYYSSPVINEPNARIKKDFWNDHYIGRLPYVRGFTFALYLNNLIKNNNKDYSLDNVILDLFKELNGKNFNIKSFEKNIKKYSDADIKLALEKFIDQGNTIILDNSTVSLPIIEKNVEVKSGNKTEKRNIYQIKSKDLSKEEIDQIKSFFNLK